MKDREKTQTYMPPESRGMTIEQEEQVATVKKILREKTDKGEWDHFTPEFVDTQTPVTNMAELLKNDETTRRIKKESKMSQDHASIRIKTDLPVTVVHIGDTHIGSVFTNMKEVTRKLKVVQDTPNMYAVFMGNMIDNAIPAQFPDNMLNSTMPPDKQVEVMQTIAKEMDAKGKVLAAVESPCHEGWTYNKTGQDVNRLIYGFEGRHFPVLENGGEVDLQVGKEKYKAAFYHQTGPFNSNFNDTHAVKQMHRLNLQMNEDWVAGAHNHVGAVEEVYEGTGRRRRKVTYMRTGSEKGTGDLHDTFIQARGGKTGEPTGQMIHLFPDKHRTMSNVDFDDGVLCHESIYLTEMAKKDKK